MIQKEKKGGKGEKMRAERCLHKATERDENGNKGNRETWRVFKKKGGRNPAKGQ